jgi:hypothetical protein
MPLKEELMNSKSDEEYESILNYYCKHTDGAEFINLIKTDKDFHKWVLDHYRAKCRKFMSDKSTPEDREAFEDRVRALLEARLEKEAVALGDTLKGKGCQNSSS